MMASVVKTAAVRPAANLPPSLRFAEVINATAPTPSASVDTPTSVVSNPHTMKSMPSRSTCGATIGLWTLDQGLGLVSSYHESSSGRPDGDSNFHANKRRVRGLQAEAQASAVRDTGRHRDAHGVIETRLASPAAQTAGLGPGFSAPTTVRAGGAHRHFDRDDQTAAGFARRQRDLGVEQVAAFAFHPLTEEPVADPFDSAPHRREVDRNLVRKAFVRHQLLWR